MTRSLINDEMLNAHIAILGTTGGGKSYTARGLVEGLVRAGRRVCVLDPVGVWWGLRADAAGDGPGLPVAIFGGERADMDVGEAGAKALGKLLAQNNIASVIDTSEMGVGQRNRFLTAFLGELYRVNKRAIWLVMEEADEIAPQRPMPESTRLLDAADRIARRGRSRGFRIIAISQRPAVIHKNVLTQIRTMIAHRLTAPQDTGAVLDWIKANADAGQAKEVISTLPRLATGEAWVWAPEQSVLERMHMPANETFDSSRTPGPDEEYLEPKTLADVDVSELREALEAEPEPETKGKGKGVKATKEQIDIAEQRGFDRGQQEAERASAAEIDRLSAVLDNVRSALGEAPAAAGAPTNAPRPQPVSVGNGRDTIPAPGRNPSARAGAPKTALKILAVLDTNPPVRMTWPQAASMVGVKARGGNFNSIRKWLRASGKLTEHDGLIQISEPSKGAPVLSSDPPERARQMRENWRSILGGTPARILMEMEDGRWCDKNQIADNLGLQPRGGNWNSCWAQLSRNNLIEISAGSARIAGWLHEGRDTPA